MDDKTANRMLWIGEGGAKVARRTDDVSCPVLDSPKRYEYSPQVQCGDAVALFFTEIILFLMFLMFNMK